MTTSTIGATVHAHRTDPGRRGSTAAGWVAVLVVAAGAVALVAALTSAPLSRRGDSGGVRQRVARLYAALPLAFEPNRGQSDPRVAFVARGQGYAAFLTRSGAVLVLDKGATRSSTTAAAEGHQRTLSEVALGLDFVGSRRSARLAPAGRLPGRTSYLLGKRPTRLATTLPSYARVTQHGIWPGVDVVWHGNQQRLEYDLVVAPGADPAMIRVAFAGATRIALDRTGNLRVHLPHGGVVTQPAPVAYERVGHRNAPVAVHYVLLRGNRVSLRIGAHDRTRPVVIDPGLVYSTYLGGGGSDAGVGIAVDRAGAAYVAGWSASTRFPTKRGAVGTAHRGGTDAFVAKLNARGTGLSYSTVLGGRGTDEASGIAVDSSGSAYVSGWTESSNFPSTPGAFQTSYSGEPQVFVAKLNPAGSGLTYATYLGPIGSATFVKHYLQDLDLKRPLSFELALDASGAAYVAGWTSSRSFPTTPGAFQTQASGPLSAFVTKLDPAGTNLVYSTYLGGSDNGVTQANAVGVDATGAAYVTGMTSQRDFPTTPGAFQTTYRGREQASNAFVTKLTPNGSGLAYSTYLSGRRTSRRDTGGRGIAVDGHGAAYVTGYTYAHDFPTTRGAFQRRFACCTDVFVTKLDPAGSALSYSTLLGTKSGSLANGGTALALDASGDAYVTGWTFPGHFPTTRNAFQRNQRGCCNWAFMTKLNHTGRALSYSTYLGGTGPAGNSFAEEGTGIAVDAHGDAYVTGSTYSRNFPTTRSAVQRRYAGGPKGASLAGGDAFVTKLSPRRSG